MFGPLKKKKTDAPKIGGNKAVDFSQVKTGGNDGAASEKNKIIANSVMKSGNISSMGLTKDEQAALVAKRNEIPMVTKALKYTSTVLFATMLAGVLFLTADLDPTNSYFGLMGLSDNTGSSYAKVSQENTQKKQDLQAIETTITKLRKRMQNQIFGNFVDTTEEIQTLQKDWFTTTKEVEVTNDETGATETEEKVVLGYLDVVDYLIGYFQDRAFKTTFFKAKEEGLVTASGSRSRGRISTSDALLMSNELALKTLVINESNANINLDVSDIYGKIFTLGGEIAEITNSTPMFKNGLIRSFQRQELESGDAGMSIALRLELQDEDEEDPADANFKYLKNWLEQEQIIPNLN